MSFIINFDNSRFTKAKYNQALKELDSLGAGAPKGRIYHICFGDPEDLKVTDVWDNIDDFQAFGQKLMPILNALDVDPGQPNIQQVNNIIPG